MNAIWATTNTRVMTLTRRLLLPRPPSFITSAGLPRELRNAGSKPDAIVATRVIARVNVRTRPSMVKRHQ